MVRFKRIPMVLFLIFFYFNISDTNAQQAEIKIVTGELPPYAYTKDGQIAGVATDIMRELMRRVGLTGDIYVRPWKRAIVESEQSRLIYPLARTPDIEKRYKWIGPILIDQLAFIVRASDKRIFTDIDDFRDFTIGVNRGAPTESRLEMLGFKKIEPVATEGQNLEKLLHGRFDVWFASVFVLKGTLEQQGISENKVKIAFSDLNVEQYIGVSPDIEDETVRLWQKNLDEMKSDGSYRIIMKKYGVNTE